jgi:hypothetical protein
MDKDKIIDSILNEWAMRSPDGLIGGHDTPENMAVLNEILAERTQITQASEFEKALIAAADPSSGVDKDINPLDGKYFKKQGLVYLTQDHPIFRSGILYNELLKKESLLKKYFKNTKDNKNISRFELKNKYKEPEWSTEYLEKIKGFNGPSAKGIVGAINELSPEDKKEFLEQKYDRLSPEETVAFLNAKASKYEKFIAAIDAARRSKGKGDDDEEGDSVGSKAGRGEYILVLLIKGAESAGILSGDIILENNTSIEVKEVDDAAETWRATRASFGGQFNRIPYIEAINELIAYCSGNEERAKALIELAENAKIVDGEGSKGKKRKELFYLKSFFLNPSVESINISTVYGLEKLGAYIRNVNKKEAEAKIMAPDKVEFDIKNQSAILKVSDVDQSLLDKVQNPPEEPKDVTIKVSSIEDDKKKAELIIPQIKRLKFFRYEKTSMDDVYTPENIAKSMFSAMSKPPGHYTGGIIFFNSKNNNFTYENDLTNLKHGKYYFQSYQQTGPTFTKKEPEKI